MIPLHGQQQWNIAQEPHARLLVTPSFALIQFASPTSSDDLLAMRVKSRKYGVPVI
jgi:hypothetical protein